MIKHGIDDIRAGRTRTLSISELNADINRSSKTIPEGNIKTGPEHALLMKINELRCLIPIQSIEVEPGAPLRPQVEKWARDNGWTVAEHNEDVKEWACISKLCRGEPPQNRVCDLRKIYTTRYLSYLVARQIHEGEITADDDLFMFSPWIMKQWKVWAKETRNLTWRSEFDKPKWSDEDHVEFDQWLEREYLNDDDLVIYTKNM